MLPSQKHENTEQSEGPWEAPEIDRDTGHGGSYQFFSLVVNIMMDVFETISPYSC